MKDNGFFIKGQGFSGVLLQLICVYIRFVLLLIWSINEIGQGIIKIYQVCVDLEKYFGKGGGVVFDGYLSLLEEGLWYFW